MSSIVFIDSEIGLESKKVLDLGAIKPDRSQFHSASAQGFSAFVSGANFICGHNIVSHDLKYIGKLMNQEKPPIPIDTLYLSPLLFPHRPYHALLKDDKLQTEELNNPLNDSITLSHRPGCRSAIQAVQSGHICRDELCHESRKNDVRKRVLGAGAKLFSTDRLH